VTNFILKKNFQGVELDGPARPEPGRRRFEYQFSGIMGTDFPTAAATSAWRCR
jgi:hypothetical protein